MLLGLDNFRDLVSNFLCAHLWLKVVGCDLGRGGQVAIFIPKLLFHSPVEESDVGVPFGFGDA